MLTIEAVSKRFRSSNYGVRDLSLEVKSGVIGLLGPNGAGKTTLMQRSPPSRGRLPGAFCFAARRHRLRR